MLYHGRGAALQHGGYQRLPLATEKASTQHTIEGEHAVDHIHHCFFLLKNIIYKAASTDQRTSLVCPWSDYKEVRSNISDYIICLYYTVIFIA